MTLSRLSEIEAQHADWHRFDAREGECSGPDTCAIAWLLVERRRHEERAERAEAEVERLGRFDRKYWMDKTAVLEKERDAARAELAKAEICLKALDDYWMPTAKNEERLKLLARAEADALRAAQDAVGMGIGALEDALENGAPGDVKTAASVVVLRFRGFQKALSRPSRGEEEFVQGCQCSCYQCTACFYRTARGFEVLKSQANPICNCRGGGTLHEGTCPVRIEVMRKDAGCVGHAIYCRSKEEHASRLRDDKAPLAGASVDGEETRIPAPAKPASGDCDEPCCATMKPKLRKGHYKLPMGAKPASGTDNRCNEWCVTHASTALRAGAVWCATHSREFGATGFAPGAAEAVRDSREKPMGLQGVHPGGSVESAPPAAEPPGACPGHYDMTFGETWYHGRLTIRACPSKGAK